MHNVFVMHNKMNNVEQHLLSPLLIDIFQAGFEGDARRLELLALTAIRGLRASEPKTSAELAAFISSRRNSFQALRGMQLKAAPVDGDSSAPLVKIEKFESSAKPIFDPSVEEQLNRFFNEWMKTEALLAEGILPPRSLLLKGAPGTGKTMFARWLAGELKLSFVTLDLASSISSYLGKTGMNLRRALDYARANPCLLLLDEFDAVAKRRDDSSEVGELKRIVNVLLKELEDWPTHSVLVAATNHPELLDPAISRRFDRVFTTNLPDLRERILILKSALGRFRSDLSEEVLKGVCEVLEGKSGSDLNTIANAAVRRHIVEEQRLDAALISETKPFLESQGKKSKALGNIVRGIKQTMSTLTIREIAALTGLVPSTVHYHLHKS